MLASQEGLCSMELLRFSLPFLVKCLTKYGSQHFTLCFSTPALPNIVTTTNSSATYSHVGVPWAHFSFQPFNLPRLDCSYSALFQASRKNRRMSLAANHKSVTQVPKSKDCRDPLLSSFLCRTWQCISLAV